MIMLKKASECYKYVHQQYVDPFKLFSNDVEKMGFFSRNGKKTKMLLHIIEKTKIFGKLLAHLTSSVIWKIFELF